MAQRLPLCGGRPHGHWGTHISGAAWWWQISQQVQKVFISYFLRCFCWPGTPLRSTSISHWVAFVAVSRGRRCILKISSSPFKAKSGVTSYNKTNLLIFCTNPCVATAPSILISLWFLLGHSREMKLRRNPFSSFWITWVMDMGSVQVCF